MMIGWTMGIEGWLLMGVWVFVLAVLVWLLVREPHHSPREDAFQILKERLARGEISPSEYERAVRLLDATTPGREHSG